ncbi:fructose 1,6-bisphosphatase [Ectocarpus siliculosus]|uniref:Fructose-1,6-bisphosphatase, cytosolic n=1 Tax=Ectocarpus siliculosus TaxID=2880 RepID=D8LTW4_ECTSI|nr:fructose 1,6-bisphosphatase [Ectocarpus siliculosus]|eukprot:CBN75354.1 fructose 1,6-bisphosphatase [Ectocarpus siliculosus]
MTAHGHHLHHGKTPGGNSSPINSATGKAAPTSPPATSSSTDGKGSSSNRKRRRRRRGLLIGPAVWAAFKEEQKGVTRTLLGFDDDNAFRKEADDTAAPPPEGAGEDSGVENETMEEELRRRRRRLQEEQRRQRPVPRTTLGTFMVETRSRSPDMEAMVPIMKSVGKTCTAVSRLVRRAQIEGMAGLHQDGGGGGAAGAGSESESVNVQGEVQKELDVLSNSIFLTGFCQPGGMSCVASEEEETPRMCAAVVGDEKHGGEYAAVFDPLDGSANIEAGLPCGTIFGILRASGSAREGRKAGPSTVVLPGRRLVAAGYCLYGPSTKLVFTLGAGVFEFTLRGEVAQGGAGEGGLGGGELDFVLTRSNLRIPRSGNVYSVNEANSVSWSEAIQDYFQDLKTTMATPPSSADGGGGGVDEEAAEVENQYAGALVADIHNVLVNGGVFAYPADVRNPNGKLRLLYEGNPIAMIVEEAGGIATTGFEAIRDVRPQSVHHRIPAFFGSPDDLLPLLDPRYLHSKKKR